MTTFIIRLNRHNMPTIAEVVMRYLISPKISSVMQFVKFAAVKVKMFCSFGLESFKMKLCSHYIEALVREISKINDPPYLLADALYVLRNKDFFKSCIYTRFKKICLVLVESPC